MKGGGALQHLSPVWQSRADFIIKAQIEAGLPKAWEQLWAKQTGPRRFEICCIPFAIYGLHLGDTVRTDDDFVVLEVTQASGHGTFRAWFGETASETEREDSRSHVLQTLKEGLACLVECYSSDLLAIDVENAHQAEAVAKFLAEMARQGRLTFESGEGELG